MTTKSIKSTGGDYTTITSFEADADTYWAGASDVFHGEIQDNRQYDESDITIAFTTTPSATQYLELSTATANFPSDGVYSTSNAYLTQGGSSHVIRVEEAYTYLHHLQLHQDGTGNSDECIRIHDCGNVLVSYVIAKTSQASRQDCVLVAGSNVANRNIYFDNCVFYDAEDASTNTGFGIGSQVSSSPNKPTIYVDHCFVRDCGIGIGTGASTSNVYGDFYVYNTVVSDCTFDCYGDNPGGFGNTVFQGGTNNIADDTTAETEFTASYNSVTFVSTSPSSGENYWAIDLSIDSFDIEGENAFCVTDNGVNRIGSESDSRQDFSLDIKGQSRSTTPNIGAFAFGDGIDTGAQTATPTVIGLTANVQAPTVDLGTVTATPNLQELDVLLQAVTLDFGVQTGTPATTQLNLNIQAPSVDTGLIASPTVIGLTVYPEQPTLDRGPVTLTPTTMALNAAVQAPVVSIGALTATPDTVVMTLTATAQRIGAIAIVAYSRVQRKWIRRVYRFDHFRVVEGRTYPVFVTSAPVNQFAYPDSLTLTVSTATPTIIIDAGPQPGDVFVIPPQDLDIIIVDEGNEFVIRS